MDAIDGEEGFYIATLDLHSSHFLRQIRILIGCAYLSLILFLGCWDLGLLLLQERTSQVCGIIFIFLRIGTSARIYSSRSSVRKTDGICTSIRC